MKRIYLLFLSLTIFCITNAQVAMKDLIVNFDLQTPVVSLINLKTGKIEMTATLKEPPSQVVHLNPEDKAVYAMTRHYLYKIDALTGDVLVEYKYQEMLIQKESDVVDPNMMLMPTYYNKDGIGLYYNMSDEVQAQVNGQHPYSPVYKINASEQSKELFGKIDKKVYVVFMASNDKIYLTKINRNGNTVAEIDVSNIDEYKVSEQLKIPINLEGNEYGLSNDQLFNWSLTEIDDERAKLTLGPNPAFFPMGTSFVYKYDLVNDKPISLKKVTSFDFEFSQSVVSQDCENTYAGKVDCPEKPLMPKMPEIYTPDRYNKKAQAEADIINDQRLQAYQKELDQWQIDVLDDSGCELQLMQEVDGEMKLLETFIGAKYATVYYDRYVYYHDGLSKVMYDLENGMEIWSVF